MVRTYGQFKQGYAELRRVEHDPEALVALLSRTEDDGPSDLQAAIILAMERHRDSAPVRRALTAVVSQAGTWRARSAATVALGGIGTEWARELLELAKRDEDRRVRRNARISLGQIARRTSAA